MTRSPKPFTSPSNAMYGLARGLSASIVRFVMLAMSPPCRHRKSKYRRLRGNTIRQSAYIGKTKGGLRQLKAAGGNVGHDIRNEGVRFSNHRCGTNNIK